LAYQKGNWIFNTIVSAAPLNGNQEIEIKLHPGWNLITNPFDTTVAWSKIQAANSITEPIWFYNDAFTQSANFDPYTGYYFDNATNLTTLRIPYAVYFSPSASSAEIETSGWRVEVTLSSADFHEKATSFGVSKEASDGLDRFDLRKPRAIGAVPSVSFHRPYWDASYSAFATDIRSEFDEAQSWEFNVSAIPGSFSRLSFSDIKRTPSHFEVYLIDLGKAQHINLQHDSVYSFTPATTISKFRVLVGKDEAVQEKLNAVLLPTTFDVSNNYPNPFNPSTTISVALPFMTEIELRVYNIMGQEIKAIYSGPLQAGRYWFEWDGKDGVGNIVAAGVYVYRFTTSAGVTMTKKMSLLR